MAKLVSVVDNLNETKFNSSTLLDAGTSLLQIMAAGSERLMMLCRKASISSSVVDGSNRDTKICFRSADESILAGELDLPLLLLGTAFSPTAVPFVPKFTLALAGLLILLIFDGWLGVLSSPAT